MYYNMDYDYDIIWFNEFRGTEELSQNSLLEGQWEKKRASAKSICSK